MQTLGDAVMASLVTSESLAAVPIPVEFQTDLAMEQMCRRASALGLSPVMVGQACERGRLAVRKGIDLCESPIEKRLLPWLVFGDYSDRLLTIPAEVHSPKRDLEMTGADLFIVPQFAFARYRMDFAVIARPADGRMHIICVECDGEEFHDARKDAGRDDYFRRWGIPTIRASGEEIHQYPASVAARVAATMQQMVED